MSDTTRTWPDRTVAILNNNDTAIVVDDHCYAIRNWDSTQKKWIFSAWIFSEALGILKLLPCNPDLAVGLPVDDPGFNKELAKVKSLAILPVPHPDVSKYI